MDGLGVSVPCYAWHTYLAPNSTGSLQTFIRCWWSSKRWEIIWNLLVNGVIGGMPDEPMMPIPAAMRDAQHGLGGLLHIGRAVNTVSVESVLVTLRWSVSPEPVVLARRNNYAWSGAATMETYEGSAVCEW